MVAIPWQRVEGLVGSCLCSGVGYEISGEISPIGQCHCSLCRKVSGGPASTTLWAKRDALRFRAGEDLIGSYSAPSGYTSAFCKRCGSIVPHLERAGQYYYVPAGTLDGDPGGGGVAVHIYVASKAPWDVIEGPAPQFEEALGSPLVER